MRREIVVLVLLAAALVLSLPATADDRSSGVRMSVSVTVMPVIRIEVGGHSTLTVSAEDIGRGWMEIPSALWVDVRTHSSSGYLVRYEVDPTVVSSALLGEKGVGVAGAFEMISGGSSTLSYDVRVELAEGVSPGTYEFPVRASVHPVRGGEQVSTNRRSHAPSVVISDLRTPPATSETMMLASANRLGELPR